MDRRNLGIRFEGVSKAFGRTVALADVTLDIPEGSYVALMGANGAGKTTLLKAVVGLAAPTRGRVTVAGVDTRRAGSGLRALIGFLSHETLLYGDLTPRENLMFHARLFGLPAPRDAVARVAAALAVERVLDRPVRTLSRGTRQRVALARALIHEPPILLLDEPYTGLDEAATVSLSALLDGVHDAGRTVVVAVHDIARALCGPERLVALDAGRVALDVPASERDADLPRTYRSLLAGAAP